MNINPKEQKKTRIKNYADYELDSFNGQQQNEYTCGFYFILYLNICGHLCFTLCKVWSLNIEITMDLKIGTLTVRIKFI